MTKHWLELAAVKREVAQCSKDFPEFAPAGALVTRLISLHTDVRANPRAVTLEMTGPVPETKNRLIKTLRFDETLFAKHLRRVTRAFVEANPASIPSPDRLERSLLQNSAKLSAELPTNPANCCAPLETAQVPEDILTLYLWSVFSPFFALAAEQISSENDFSDWSEGSCPVCGAAPHNAKLREEDGARMLECWLCGTEWQHMRLKCPFCENTDQDTQGFFYLDEDKARRVHFCRQCNAYFKVVDVKGLRRDPVLTVHNLATLHHDEAAISEGFRPGSGLVWYCTNGQRGEMQ